MTLDGKFLHGLVKQARGILLGLACTITHKTPSSKDAYGKVTFSPGDKVKAFASQNQKRVVLADGREVVSGFQLLIPENRVVAVIDQIIMPDGSRPPILQVQAVLDDLGQPYATEVFF